MARPFLTTSTAPQFTTLRLATDVRAALAEMAQRNVSTATAELNRCVRLVAAREQRARAQAS
jgi:hypothetical protein